MTQGPTPPPGSSPSDQPQDSPRDPFGVGQHAARARRVAVDVGARARRLNAFERVLWAVVALIAFVFGLVLLLPFLILGIAVVVVVVAWATLRQAFAGGKTGPPGDQGRRNVRVITRRDPP